MPFALSPMQLTSPAFASGGNIPRKHTGEGEDVSPALAWSQVPDGTRSFALVCHDPDAPLVASGEYGFTHWLAYNIPAWVPGVPESIPPSEHVYQPVEMMQGKNSSLKVGYAGCAPPKGDSEHHYHFQLFALDRVLDLEAGAGRSALVRAMSDHVIGKGDLVGTYKR